MRTCPLVQDEALNLLPRPAASPLHCCRAANVCGNWIDFRLHWYFSVACWDKSKSFLDCFANRKYHSELSHPRRSGNIRGNRREVNVRPNGQFVDKTMMVQHMFGGGLVWKGFVFFFLGLFFPSSSDKNDLLVQVSRVWMLSVFSAEPDTSPRKRMQFLPVSHESFHGSLPSGSCCHLTSECWDR